MCGPRGYREAAEQHTFSRSVAVMIPVGILKEWPDEKFRISVNYKGDTLTIRPGV